MSPESIERALGDLVAIYGNAVRVASEGPRTLVQIDGVEMPPGCRPATTSMLLVFDSAQPRPVPYVAPGQLLANGGTPRSTSVQVIGGESWMHFSFNIPWTENEGIIQFIGIARQRFAQQS
jgi:hypothetical protein